MRLTRARHRYRKKSKTEPIICARKASNESRTSESHVKLYYTFYFSKSPKLKLFHLHDFDSIPPSSSQSRFSKWFHFAIPKLLFSAILRSRAFELCTSNFAICDSSLCSFNHFIALLMCAFEPIRVWTFTSEASDRRPNPLQDTSFSAQLWDTRVVWMRW